MKISIFRASIMAAAISIVIAGCSTSNEDPTANWSANKIYDEARSEINSSNFEKAIPLLEKLEGRASGGILAQQAQLEKAYAQHRNGEAEQAISTLDRFITLHPTSPAMDYALYLKGLATFNENLGLFGFLTKNDLSERDQKAAKESFESLKILVDRFPNSQYASDARQRMRYIINSLAAYEVHVARYYFSREAYVAAANRAQLAVQNYTDAPALAEALDILKRSYDALGIEQLSNDTQRVIDTSFPEGNPLQKQQKNEPFWKFW